MFNSTSRILPYASGQLTGVILPHSEKVLTSQDLDKKIAKTKEHIEHLNNQLPHRNTHGGKGFRAKRISLQNQISLASDRLKLLQMAKVAIPKVQPVAPIREHTMLETTAAVASVARRIFGTPASIGFSLEQSSTVMFGGREHTFTVIKNYY